MRKLSLNKSLLLFVFPCFFSWKANSQHFSIYINDNLGTQYNSAIYKFTNDSLIITGVSDFGRARVNYLNRKLNKSEVTALQQFIRSFPIDSLMDVYFNDYSNFQYISADNFPRVLEVEVVKGKKLMKSKATNSFVSLYARLFEAITPLLPEEVKLKYDRAEYNAFY